MPRKPPVKLQIMPPIATMIASPIIVALAVIAARDGCRATLLWASVLVPSRAMTSSISPLKSVAIGAGPVVASQSGFTAPERELIAFAYQFGTLILPTVVPAVAWVLTHRAFLERMREQDAPAGERLRG